MKRAASRRCAFCVVLLVAATAPSVNAENVATPSTPAADAARSIIDSGRYQRALPGQESHARRPPPLTSGGSGFAGRRRPPPLPPATTATGLDDQRDVVTGLLFVMAALAALLLAPPLVRSIARFWRARRPRPAQPAKIATHVDTATDTATPADRLRQEAAAMAAAGRTRDAILWLWRSSLAAIAGQPLPPPPDATTMPFRTAAGADLTGREIVHFLASQHAITPPRRTALDTLLRHMELAVFGLKDLTLADFARCDSAFATITSPAADAGGDR